MRIVVPVTRVASLDEDFELEGAASQIDPDYLEWGANEWDNFALEEALAIRDRSGAELDEVIVISVGDDACDDLLRTCLAKGADRAIRVWDESIGDLDPLVVARVLSSVIGRESVDLVLCGVQTSDSASGVVGAGIAGYLDLPRVAVVTRIGWTPERLTAHRELEGGLVEVVQITTPAVLTIQTGINEPRYATFRAIKLSRQKPLAVLSPAELDLDNSSLAGARGSQQASLGMPPKNSAVEMITGDAPEIAARVISILERELAA